VQMSFCGQVLAEELPIMPMKTCYVSMPFGVKTDFVNGRTVDFDAIYRLAIKPAVEAAGLACVRADEIEGSFLVQKPVFAAVLGSEVMLADLTTANPNVFFELGMRYAARPRTTILMVSGTRPLPFDIAYARFIRYELDNAGHLGFEESRSLQAEIHRAIVKGLERIEPDSPVYAFFPDMKELRQDDEDLPRSLERIDAASWIDRFKAYRDDSAWDQMIALYEEVPYRVRRLPEVAHLLALALNRRAKSGDQDRAVEVMKELISQAGGDAETYGILGRIYKDLFVESRSQSDLQAAIEAYRAALDRQPTDLYSGTNLISLLLQRRDPDAMREVESRLPKLREAVSNAIEAGPVGSWELSMALFLACAARAWDQAEDLARRMREAPSWVKDGTLRDLEVLAAAMEVADRERLDRVVGLVAAGRRSEGGSDA
jgi:tetratricopeptide (TPR) repeat protein